MNRLRQPTGEQTRAHGQRRFVDHLPSPRRHNRCSQDSAAESVPSDRPWTRNQLDETLGGTVGDRPIHFIKRQLRNSASMGGGFRFGHTDTSHFRCCEDRPRHPVRLESTADSLAESVAGSKAAHLIGGMGEWQLPSHIADRKDTANTGFETVIGLNKAAIVQFHPDLFQGHVSRIRNTADSDQETLDLMTAVNRHKANRTLRRFNTLNGYAYTNIYPG